MMFVTLMMPASGLAPRVINSLYTLGNTPLSGIVISNMLYSVEKFPEGKGFLEATCKWVFYLQNIEEEKPWCLLQNDMRLMFTTS